MAKLLRLAAVVALLSVACRAEINLVMEVQETGAGTFAAELGFDDEMRQLIELGADGEDITELIFGSFNIEIPGATTEQRTEGDMTFFVTKAPFDNVEQASRELFGSDPDNPFTDLRIEIGEEQASIEASVDVPDATDLGDAQGLPIDPSTLTAEIFSFNFIVSMPGTIDSHNADEVLADGRLRWDIPITGGQLSIMAISTFGESSFPWWIVIVGAALLLALVVAVMIVRGRKSGSVAAIEEAGAEEPESAGDWVSSESDAAPAAPPAAEAPREVSEQVPTAEPRPSPPEPTRAIPPEGTHAIPHEPTRAIPSEPQDPPQET